VNGTTGNKQLISAIPLSIFNNDSAWSSTVGTVTLVGGGTGLSGTVSVSGNINLDLNSLPVGGTLLATDHLAASNGTASEKQLISAIPLGIFSNDQGWTSNAGTVTSVSGGVGISSTGAPAITLALTVDELSEKTGNLVGTDRLVGTSGTTNFAETISMIPLSIFTNDDGWTSNTGNMSSWNWEIEGTPHSISNTGTAELIAGTNVTISYSLGGSGEHQATINASGGTSVSFGTTTQIPYMNAGGTDFIYSSGLIYNGTDFTVGGAVAADSTFKSTDTSMFLGTTGSGNVYIRPAGFGSSTDQSVFGTTTATIGTNMTVNAGTVSTFTVYGSTTGSAWAAGIVLKSAQEQRGRGTFYTSDANSSEWFAGIGYNMSNAYTIGYDASAGQGEYLASSLLQITTAGLVSITPTSGKALNIARIGGETSIIAIDDVNGHMIIDSAGTDFAALNYYSSNNVILAYGGGMVGVGNDASPAYMLDVTGDGRFTTNLIVNNELTVNGYWQIIDLPSMSMGAGGVTDEYIVLARKWISGTGFPAYGYNGSLHFQRGSASTGNSICKVDLVFQCAYSTNYLEKFVVNGTQAYTQIDEIEIDSVKYYALKARTAGGGQYYTHQWVGDHYNSDSDANILTRVRASDANVTVTVSGAWMPDTHTGSTRTVEGSIYASAEIESYDTSDVRFKDIIESLDKEKTAKAVLGLDTFRYTQKGEDRVRLGLSAQEVQMVFPENVKEAPDGKLLVHYGKMVPALIATIQRQDERIDELEKLVNNDVSSE